MPTEDRLQKIKRVVANRQQGAIILENIVDPHNAEAAVRSCDAFGIQRICFVFETVKSFRPDKVGKASSSSANKWVDFSTYSTTEECISSLKAEGFEVIATVLDAEAESLYTAKLEHPKPAIMFGNESGGLSEKAIKLADRKMYIPMQGFVQSLNISVTASIFLFELSRRRQGEIEKHAYDGNIQEELVKNFQER